METKIDDRPIKLGVSRCLLGEKVRYDGSHKLDRYVTEILGPYVEFVPVCPEVECGLPVPRESMRLVGEVERPRLVTGKTGIDHTDMMLEWADDKLDELEDENLCGFVFKSKSPSSGMARVKVYQENGQPKYNGVGIWARAFMDRFPYLPVEDEGRLNDAGLRENFIERIFAFQRFNSCPKSKLGDLVEFHTTHKLMYMAHSPKMYREMGAFVAKAKDLDLNQAFSRYYVLMSKCLALKATIPKNVNALQHVMGYFKKQLTADEKQELLEVIANYGQGLVPLIVPITLVNHYTRKYDQHYLKNQHYLTPHPIELKLRNHV